MIPDSPLSLRAYAKRRGINHVAVQRAVRSGRLVGSVVLVNERPMIADPDLADREWEANTDLTKAPAYVKEREAQRVALSRQEAEDLAPHAAPARPVQVVAEHRVPETMAEASVAEKYWKAQLAELNYRKEAGELVPAAEVAGEISNVFTEVKNKLLGVPSRARQRDPSFTAAQLGTVEELIREALEALADSGAKP